VDDGSERKNRDALKRLVAILASGDRHFDLRHLKDTAVSHPELPLPQLAAQIPQRLTAVDWTGVGEELDEFGAPTIGPILSEGECAALTAVYTPHQAFRSRVVMARHGFGRGEYQYFSNPLPEPIQALREGSFRGCHHLPTDGTSCWASRSATRTSWRSSSSAATPPARHYRRH